ncbi:hypothetical protein LO762_07110 [Actinocorallia sp. API 0066]|uniref:hypothetical protein n=1 Tax=Actinocorallia sp. API 0066 TaxID=2896846 RepID=UPI001E436D27|nr:hypothetical protein [Actinocorallia sp. API 0066]MCD0448958.1 hypothetical protein [Actinocorallia sp. API 0066]
MELNEAAEELYRVAPGEFVQTRRRLAEAAKAAGDAATAQQIKALRRPTVSAWAVNLLVRERPPLAGELLSLGERLREAWAKGGDTAEFDRARTPLVDKAVRAAESLVEEAGRPLGDQARREVEETLYAAVADADVAAEVAAGRLTHPRSYVGFGLPPLPEDPTEPPKPDDPGESPKRDKRDKGGKRDQRARDGVAVGKPPKEHPEPHPDQDRAEKERAERKEHEAREERRRAAERERFEARRRAAQLRAKADELAAERDRLRRALQDVEQEEESLRQRLDQVRVHRSAARKSFEAAEQQAAAAATAATRAESGLT